MAGRDRIDGGTSAEGGSLSAMTEDGQALETVLRDLEARASRFGATMTSALASAVAGGRGLDQVLTTLASRLVEISLSAGLKPLQDTLPAGIGSVFSSLAGSAAGGQSAPFSGAGGLAAPAFLADRMNGSGAEGGALGSGGRAGSAAPGPNIVFNVTAADTESFRRSEGQIAAMLARTVGRGRRGV
jgi:phage-related minor tail protein